MFEQNQTLNLLALTTQFYEQIAMVKRLHQEGGLKSSVMQQLDMNEEPTSQDFAYGIALRFQHWFENTRQRYDKVLTEKEKGWLERTFYALAALADEIFLIELDWPGQKGWRTELLEETLFQSCRAGTQVFQDIEQLLKAKSLAQTERQLAGVYLLSLRLGFLGQCRQDEAQLLTYRQRLFRVMSHQMGDEDAHYCEQAYAHLLSSKVPQQLAPVSVWMKRFFLTGFAFFIMSSMIWGWQSWQFDQWLHAQEARIQTFLHSEEPAP
ncbi:DotU family type IV/VI secretion system protein [Algicola sagamiensis]|uniref:DotU family type IV/VI secretion system protein n=1 Tax=Algicola sagamiensis TaxID=163869 RepID=UPI0003796EBF|nr:DotU family type IV/VI secretion system protein [Algicola sagamiensis]